MSALTASNPTPQPGAAVTLEAVWDAGLTLSYALLDVRTKAPGATTFGAWVRADQAPTVVASMTTRRMNSPGPYRWTATLATGLADGTGVEFRASPQGGTAPSKVVDLYVTTIKYRADLLQKVTGKTKVSELISSGGGRTLSSITFMARKTGNPGPMTLVLREGDTAPGTLIEQVNGVTVPTAGAWTQVTVPLTQSRHLSKLLQRVVVIANTAPYDATANFYEVAPYPLDPGEGVMQKSTDDGATWSTPVGGEAFTLGIFGWAAADVIPQTPDEPPPPALPPAPVAALSGWQEGSQIILDASASTGEGLTFGFTDETGQSVGTLELLNARETVGLPAPGSHTYMVTVADSADQTDTETVTINVTAPPPVADFKIIQGDCAGQLIFDSSGASGQGLIREWTITGQTKMPTVNWDSADQIVGWGMYTIENEPGVLAPVTATLKVTDAQGRTDTKKATRQPIWNFTAPVAEYDGYNPTGSKWGAPFIGRPYSWRSVSAINDARKDPPNLVPYYEDGRLVGQDMRVVGSDDRVTEQGGIRVQFGLPGASLLGLANGFAMDNPDPWGMRIGPRAAGQSSGRTVTQPRFMRWEITLLEDNVFPMRYTGWVYTYNGGIKIGPDGKPMFTDTTNADGTTRAWTSEEVGVMSIHRGYSGSTGPTFNVVREGITFKRLTGVSDVSLAGEPIYADSADIHNFAERHGSAPGSSTIKITVDKAGKMLVGSCAQDIDKNWTGGEKQVPFAPLEKMKRYRIIEETKMRTVVDDQAGDPGYVRWYLVDDDGTVRCVSMGVTSFTTAKYGPAYVSTDGKIYGAFRKTFGTADTRNSEATGLAGQIYLSPSYMYRVAARFTHCCVGTSIADVMNKDIPTVAVAA